MTVSDILFGFGVHSTRNTEWAKLFGVTRETIRKWRSDPGLIRLRDLQTIVRVQDMSDEDILRIVRGRGNTAMRIGA